MGEFVLTCFGTGDGWPCADRNHASFLYRLGRDTVLVDCGDGVSGGFHATGLDYNTIDRIFISHLHADHFGGLFMLLQGFWLERRRKELPVHLPGDGVKLVRQMLRAGMIFAELLRFKLRLAALRAGKAVVTGNARVTPHRSSHLERLRKVYGKKYPLRYEAFCFLIEAGKKRIGHSADLGSPKDLEPLLQKPLDLLVCELAHFKAEDLFRYLRGRDIRQVVLVHLARAHSENLEKTRRLAERMLPDIPVTFARDQEQMRF
jgi:ribonuclease BN (tRNA processing enzyme)